MRRRRKIQAELGALRQELDVLRAENARLRLARQTPSSPGAVGERARTLNGVAQQDDHGDDGDDAAATMLANAAMIRTSVLAVCADLQTTLGQLQRRLQSDAPPAELDRRVGERRSGDADRVVPVAVGAVSGPGVATIPAWPPHPAQPGVTGLAPAASANGSANGSGNGSANGHHHPRLAEGA